jgi:hypothetical protein
MNKKGQEGAPLGEIILIFVGVIMGIAMIGQVFDTQNLVTELQSVTDESDSLSSCYGYNLSETGLWDVNESNSACNITLSNWYDSGNWRASESQCYLSSVVVTNSTGTVLTESTDYNLFEDSGIIQFLNTTSTNNNSLADNITLTDYSFCDEGYNKEASSRGVAKLWGIFGALIILSAAVYGIRRWL